jgi:hypothetical protein
MFGKRPPEADVTLSDGSVIRVMGDMAVQFRKDPEAVRKLMEQIQIDVAVERAKRKESYNVRKDATGEKTTKQP